MSEHKASVAWKRMSEGFTYPEYNREHEWAFPGGTLVQASAAPSYLGLPERVDPEEAFVATIASCHMLTFLAICARKGMVVDEYRDSAIGYLQKNPAGQLAITHVELSPEVSFGKGEPSPGELEILHNQSHEQCFIANSVRTVISIRPLSSDQNQPISTAVDSPTTQ